MSSGVFSRKKNDKTMAPRASQVVAIDLGVSRITDALTDRPNSGGDKKSNSVNAKKGPREGSAMKQNIYIVFLLLIICTRAYYHLAPTSHKKIVNEQLQQLSKSLQAEKMALDSKYEILEKQINAQKDDLVAYMNSANIGLQEQLEKAKTAFGDSVGFVTKEHHNEEVINLRSQLEKMESQAESEKKEIFDKLTKVESDHDGQVADLKSRYDEQVEKLESSVSDKKAISDELEKLKSHHDDEVKTLESQHKEGVKKLESDLEKKEAERVTLQSLLTTEVNKLEADLAKNQGIIDELQSHHQEEVGKMEQAALDKLHDEIERNKKELALVKATIDAKKLDLKYFCAKCNFKVGGDCAARKNFVMKNDGVSEDIAKEAVMKMDPNCVNK